jgi:hypothetical protein
LGQTSFNDKNEKFKSVDSDTIGVVKAFTGLNIKVNTKGGKIDMCKAAEELERSCKAEGIIQFAIESGIPEREFINDLQKDLDIDLNQTKAYIKEFGNKKD